MSIGPDVAQVAEHQGVGADQGGFLVGQVVPQAEGPDERLRPTQGGARHAREQVVLDLVVQSRPWPVDPASAADVARGEHLAAEEVQLVAGPSIGMPLWLGANEQPR